MLPALADADQLDLVELLLSAICDDFSLVDYEDEEGPFTTLHLVKRAGARE